MGRARALVFTLFLLFFMSSFVRWLLRQGPVPPPDPGTPPITRTLS